jgi:hypothetical protein
MNKWLILVLLLRYAGSSRYVASQLPGLRMQARGRRVWTALKTTVQEKVVPSICRAYQPDARRSAPDGQCASRKTATVGRRSSLTVPLIARTSRC